MAHFASEAELKGFLGSLDPDYGQYASALWQNGVRTARQLASADKEDLVAAGVNFPIHATDIKASAGPQASSVAASSDDLGFLESVAEAAAERVYKWLKYTQTPVHTAREAGDALLYSSQLCGAELVHTLLGDMPDTPALEAAARSLKQHMEERPVHGSSDGHVQMLVIKLFTDMHSGFNVHGRAAMLVWDTQLQGLAVSDSSIRAKPDLLASYAEAPQVVSVVAAKGSLVQANNHVDVAFQLHQRVEQLEIIQTKRSSWVLAAVGDKSVEIWHIKQGCQSRRTGLLGLSPHTTSPGLQALVRLYYSNPQQLGYVFPALPDRFQLLDGQVVVPRARLVPLPPSSGISSRAADVFRGSIGEIPVVLKTSADISKEAAYAINCLAVDGHIHGDVSPHNISCQDGTATLIHLATLRPIDQASKITGTPAFMSLAIRNGQPQCVCTELESLLYSMLYAATQGGLHWGAYLHTDCAARDAKLATMAIDDEFDLMVLSRLHDSLLTGVAKRLRALFFKSGKCLQGVQCKDFIAAIDQSLEADCAV